MLGPAGVTGPPEPIPHAGVWGLARLGRALTPNLGRASAPQGHMKDQRGGRPPKGKLGRCFQKTGMALRQAEVTRHHASILLARSSPRPEGPLASCVRSSPMGGSQNPARSSLICFTSVNSLTHAPFTEERDHGVTRGALGDLTWVLDQDLGMRRDTEESSWR